MRLARSRNQETAFRFMFPVTRSANMSIIRFRRQEVIEQLLSCPMDSWMNCSAAEYPASGQPSKEIELVTLLPGYVSRLSARYECPKTVHGTMRASDGCISLSSFKQLSSEYRFHIKVVGHVERCAAEADVY